MLTTFLVVINFNYGSKWKLFVYVVFDIKHEMRRAALVALQQKQHRDGSKLMYTWSLYPRKQSFLGGYIEITLSIHCSIQPEDVHKGGQISVKGDNWTYLVLRCDVLSKCKLLLNRWTSTCETLHRCSI